MEMWGKRKWFSRSPKFKEREKTEKIGWAMQFTETWWKRSIYLPARSLASKTNLKLGNSREDLTKGDKQYAVDSSKQLCKEHKASCQGDNWRASSVEAYQDPNPKGPRATRTPSSGGGWWGGTMIQGWVALGKDMQHNAQTLEKTMKEWKPGWIW